MRADCSQTVRANRSDVGQAASASASLCHRSGSAGASSTRGGDATRTRSAGIGNARVGSNRFAGSTSVNEAAGFDLPAATGAAIRGVSPIGTVAAAGVDGGDADVMAGSGSTPGVSPVTATAAGFVAPAASPMAYLGATSPPAPRTWATQAPLAINATMANATTASASRRSRPDDGGAACGADPTAEAGAGDPLARPASLARSRAARRRDRRGGRIASECVVSRARLSADLQGWHSRPPGSAGWLQIVQWRAEAIA